MSLRINNNTEAMNTHRQLMATSGRLSKAMEKLSSGYRINHASDDAAGLGISEKMRGQIRGLAQAQRNIQDGVSMVQTAEGNLDEVHAMLQRIRELGVQYQNGSQSAGDKLMIQNEADELVKEIARTGKAASFNGNKLLDGTAGTAGAVTFQVGANDGETITANFDDLQTKLVTGFSWTAGSETFDLSSATALTDLDSGIAAVSDMRAGFGAVQNRLEHTLAVSATSQENLVSAESRIRDVDMADEMTQLTKEQILSQAGTAMLSQANSAPQMVLSLLKG